MKKPCFVEVDAYAAREDGVKSRVGWSHVGSNHSNLNFECIFKKEKTLKVRWSDWNHLYHSKNLVVLQFNKLGQNLIIRGVGYTIKFNISYFLSPCIKSVHLTSTPCVNAWSNSNFISRII